MLVSLYKPPHVVATRNDWENIFNQLNDRVLVCGDFNSHHRVWGSGYESSQGEILNDTLENTDLIILNNGKPTKITPPNHSRSAIDITLASSQLVSFANWDVLDDAMGSDHYPIFIRLKFKHTTGTIFPSRKWKDSMADWDRYQQFLETKLTDVTFDVSNENLYTLLSNAMEDSATLSMPKTKPTINPKHSLPFWWDDECKSMSLKRAGSHAFQCVYC